MPGTSDVHKMVAYDQILRARCLLGSGLDQGESSLGSGALWSWVRETLCSCKEVALWPWALLPQ